MAFPIQLVRLYVRWQGSQADTAEAEAEDFRQWLLQEHAELAAQTSAVEILQLVKSQRERTSAVTAGRRETRVQENIQVLINVEGRAGPRRAQTHDTGIHGMRLEGDVELPDDASFQLTVAPSGFPITIFNLEGTARWITRTEDGYAVGVQVKESLDFSKWKKRFETDGEEDQSADGDN